MASKLKIKIGSIEFEYEGEAEFTQENIKDLFSHIEALSGSPAATKATPRQAASGASSGTIVMHTASIASRLNAKTDREVTIAAAAHLQLVSGKQAYTRQELLDDMKEATGFYKAGMVGNFSKTLKILVTAKELNQVSSTEYSLSKDKLVEVEKALVE